MKGAGGGGGGEERGFISSVYLKVSYPSSRFRGTLNEPPNQDP